MWGTFPRWLRPSRRMLMDTFVSLSSSQPNSQMCQRSSRDFLRTVPHAEQTWEVYLAGETSNAYFSEEKDKKLFALC